MLFKIKIFFSNSALSALCILLVLKIFTVTPSTMAPRMCCVTTCFAKSDKRYHIPSNEKVKQVWLQRIGNAELFNVKSVNLKNYVVCGIHFSTDCILPDGKLKKFSLPTLNLPEYVSSANNEDIFFEYHRPTSVTPDRDITSGTTTFTGNSPELKVLIPSKVFGRKNLPLESISEIAHEDDFFHGVESSDEPTTSSETFQSDVTRVKEYPEDIMNVDVPSGSRKVSVPKATSSTSRKVSHGKRIASGKEISVLRELRLFRRMERHASLRNISLKEKLEALKKNFSNEMVDIVQKRYQWNDSPSSSADLTASCEKDSTPSTSKRAKSTTVSSSSSKRSASEAFSDVATNFDQDEDFNDLFIKIVGFKFRKLREGQKVLAEKIINEVLFEAQLGHLTMQTKLVHSATSNNNSQMGASNYGILEEQMSPSVNIKSEHSLGSENYLDLGE